MGTAVCQFHEDNEGSPCPQVSTDLCAQCEKSSRRPGTENLNLSFPARMQTANLLHCSCLGMLMNGGEREIGCGEISTSRTSATLPHPWQEMPTMGCWEQPELDGSKRKCVMHVEGCMIP